MSTFSPVFAEIDITSSGEISKKSAISFLTSSVLAAGKSILFTTGIIVSPSFLANSKLVIVCA